MQDNLVAKKSLFSDSPGFIRRFLLAFLGILFVGIGAIGALLPGIPTVGPLLFASFLFAKSCPWLEDRLIRNRFFAPFLPYLDGREEMPVRAKLTTIAIMWTSIGISLAIYRFSGFDSVWFVPAMLIAGFIGTIFISRFGRRDRGDDQPVDEQSAV